MVGTLDIYGTRLICLWRRVPSMSLVRICMMTMSILRLVLCMCSRARHKERKKKRETIRRQGTDEEEACGSMIELYSEKERSVVAQAKRELKLHTFLSKKKHIFFSSRIPNAFPKRDVGPAASHLPPHQVLVDQRSRHVWQDERLHQLLKRWLLRLWRWKNSTERINERHNRLQNVACHQVIEREVVLNGKESCDSIEEESRVPAIAWAEPSETYDFETPSCSFRHEESSTKPQRIQQLEQSLKTLLDDYLERDIAGTFSYKECLAYFGDACPCRFLLPNQIVGMGLCYRAASQLQPLAAPTMSGGIELSLKSRVELLDIEDTD